MTGGTSSRDQSGTYLLRTGPYPVRGGPVPVGGGSRGRREAVGDPTHLQDEWAGKGVLTPPWAQQLTLFQEEIHINGENFRRARVNGRLDCTAQPSEH